MSPGIAGPWKANNATAAGLLASRAILVNSRGWSTACANLPHAKTLINSNTRCAHAHGWRYRENCPNGFLVTVTLTYQWRHLNKRTAILDLKSFFLWSRLIFHQIQGLANCANAPAEVALTLFISVPDGRSHPFFYCKTAGRDAAATCHSFCLSDGTHAIRQSAKASDNYTCQ